MSGSTVLNTFNYNFDSASQLTSASATDTQMTYTFDNLGRVLTASNSGTTNIPTTVQTNVYDANSRRTQQTQGNRTSGLCGIKPFGEFLL